MGPLMNSRHEQFAQLVARGASATQAYVAAGYAAKDAQVAAVNASRLLARDKVVARVTELRARANAELMERLQVSREDITRVYAAIAFADPADLVEVKVAACRHCHGVEHAYQWRSEAEFEQAHAAWARKRDARRSRRTPFPDPEPRAEGGFGYSRRLRPNEDCPLCDGAGEPWVRTRASRGHPLFAGARMHPDGSVEVKLVDRMPALEALARILGLFEPRAEPATCAGGALKEALVERMRQAASLPALNAGRVLPQAGGGEGE